MDLVNLQRPAGTAWELFLVIVVIIAAPVIIERVRIPGLIGLLAGGCILGPSVLGVVSSTSGILHELGEVGLLYLMFLAGLELDLNVFAHHRRHAAVFTALTFTFPFVLGFLGGLVVGYDVTASILLGSTWASYTLVVYPIVRNMGLAANPAVATAVGATVLTDTAALVVLAVVAGSTTGDASGGELLAQVTIGIAILLAFTFVVLPAVARWFFRGIGTARTLRYAFILAALLAAAALAEVVGIESIVGAFFAGLALNRLVPNEGEFMEHIEFFGSSLLIPMFLVSVGTVIDPAVLVDPTTLGIAAVFTVACVGGKLIGALLCRPLLGVSWPEAGVMFALSVAQAAATLAAAFVGLEIGLFTSTTVNAAMIVIVVSLIIASFCAERYGARLDKPAPDASRLGRVVLTQAGDPDDLRAVLALAAHIAHADSGVVRPTYIVADGEPPPNGELVEAIAHEIDRLGIDSELRIQRDRSVTDGLLHGSDEVNASLVVVPAETQSWLPALLGAGQHALVAASTIPVVLVRPGAQAPERVVLALSASQARRPGSATFGAASVAARLGRAGLELVVVAGAELREDLAALIDRVEAIVGPSTAWVGEHARPDDVVVMPGGRNGALATARTTKTAVAARSTIAVVADRESVGRSAIAAEGLGVVTRRPTTAAT